ncbi:amidohydrolase [Pontibacter sp. 172403-2]|uniref:amidohydrolase n=1 Tax=Pontibacter rufus TaxID=2791028 RepID=UPI0018AF62BC|nr:amidohydrolase [Pontibacter sp. 172403-2]MBF9255551.1 amidohydrolase [Pontibacter sp. 172403-2]
MTNQLKLPHHNALTAFRHELHRHPDLSGREQETAERIAAFLKQYHPDQLLIGLGGTGVAAVFNGIALSEGPTVLFRAELDALPIAEANSSLPYKSIHPTIAHTCGHDGHMAILAGLASLLHRQKPATGRVILLYQPAEETGAGAWAVLQDKSFTDLLPDYVFALHNLPGVPLHQVVVRQEVFAAASTGMVIALQGKSSHAAEPENGLNPGEAMAEIILVLNRVAANKAQFKDLTLLTIIHARLGDIAFGTNPGFATVMATLRAYKPRDLQLLRQQAQQAATRLANRYKLAFTICFEEEFPATINNSDAVGVIQRAAHKTGLQVQEAGQPFRWSEDFGHFTNRYKGALFGLGAGISQPQLHHADYDFPDELLASGASLFYAIAQEILNP